MLSAVHHTALHFANREDGRCIVDKVAHEQVVKIYIAVFLSQLVEVKQVAATTQRIFNVDDLAELFVLAEHAAGQAFIANVNFTAAILGFPLVEERAIPEGVGLIRHARRGGKVGRTVAGSRRHTRCSAAQFLEAGDPEIFIQVQIARSPLGGVGVGV